MLRIRSIWRYGSSPKGVIFCCFVGEIYLVGRSISSGSSQKKSRPAKKIFNA